MIYSTYYRELCDKTVPGNKVTVTGIYAIKKAAKSKSERNGPKVNVGQSLRSPALTCHVYLCYMYIIY